MVSNLCVAGRKTAGLFFTNRNFHVFVRKEKENAKRKITGEVKICEKSEEPF